MSRISVFLLVVVLTLISVAPVRAANDVKESATKSPMAGVITANGTYTIDMGYTLKTITAFAKPVGGGQGGNALCNTGKDKNGNLTWSSAPITGLDQNTTYNVDAEMVIIENSTLNKLYFYSNIMMQKADGK